MKISVDTGQVLQSASQMKQDAQAYEQLVQRIHVRMQSISSVWQGSDNLAFINSAESLQPKLRQLKDVIDQYAVYLEKSAQAYQALQADRTAAARRLP